MLGWKGLVKGFQKCIICWYRTCADLFRLDFGLTRWGGGGLGKNLVKPWLNNYHSSNWYIDISWYLFSICCFLNFWMAWFKCCRKPIGFGLVQHLNHSNVVLKNKLPNFINCCGMKSTYVYPVTWFHGLVVCVF